MTLASLVLLMGLGVLIVLGLLLLVLAYTQGKKRVRGQPRQAPRHPAIFQSPPLHTLEPPAFLAALDKEHSRQLASHTNSEIVCPQCKSLRVSCVREISAGGEPLPGVLLGIVGPLSSETLQRGVDLGCFACGHRWHIKPPRSKP